MEEHGKFPERLTEAAEKVKLNLQKAEVWKENIEELLKLKYSNVNLERFRQKYDYAYGLGKSTGESNIPYYNIPYYRYIIKMYDELKDMESEMLSDVKIIKKEFAHLGYDGITRDVMNMYRICQIYHTIEYIRDEIIDNVGNLSDVPTSKPQPPDIQEGGVLPAPQPPAPKEKQPPRFYHEFTPDEQGALFVNLKKGGFLPQNTPYSHFCYVFGQTPIPDNEEPFKPLIWQGRLDDLVYFIVSVAVEADCKSQWEATASHFLHKGNPPNKKTMKTMANKNKNYHNNKAKQKRYEKIRAATSY